MNFTWWKSTCFKCSIRHVCVDVCKKKKKKHTCFIIMFFVSEFVGFFNLVYWFCISMLVFLLKAACSFELKIYLFLCHIKCFL